MIVTIVDTRGNLNKIKSKRNSTLLTATPSNTANIYTPKKKKGVVGKLKHLSHSSRSEEKEESSSSDWEDSSECEETKMAFEDASTADTDEPPLVVKEVEHDLPPLNFDLMNMMSGAFVKSEGTVGSGTPTLDTPMKKTNDSLGPYDIPKNQQVTFSENSKKNMKKQETSDEDDSKDSRNDDSDSDSGSRGARTECNICILY